MFVIWLNSYSYLIRLKGFIAATFLGSESEQDGTKLIRSWSIPIHSVWFRFNTQINAINSVSLHSILLEFVPFHSFKISGMLHSVPFCYIFWAKSSYFQLTYKKLSPNILHSVSYYTKIHQNHQNTNKNKKKFCEWFSIVLNNFGHPKQN